MTAGELKQRIKADVEGDCLTNSQEDEPVFVLVARDRLAASIVREWARRASSTKSVSMTKAVQALEVAKAMDDWREAHGGGKLPD